MDISVLKNAAVKMVAVHQWMDHVTVQLVTLERTVLSWISWTELYQTLQLYNAWNLQPVHRKMPVGISMISDHL